MTRLKFALLGCGRIASKHVDALQQLVVKYIKEFLKSRKKSKKARFRW